MQAMVLVAGHDDLVTAFFERPLTNIYTISFKPTKHLVQHELTGTRVFQKVAQGL